MAGGQRPPIVTTARIHTATLRDSRQCPAAQLNGERFPAAPPYVHDVPRDRGRRGCARSCVRCTCKQRVAGVCRAPAKPQMPRLQVAGWPRYRTHSSPESLLCSSTFCMHVLSPVSASSFFLSLYVVFLSFCRSHQPCKLCGAQSCHYCSMALNPPQVCVWPPRLPDRRQQVTCMSHTPSINRHSVCFVRASNSQACQNLHLHKHW